MSNGLLRAFKTIGLILILGGSMSGCGTDTFTWKEEVLLHDGKKIIVEMSDTYDPSMRHEIGQRAPLAEHKTTFTIPGTTQTVSWKSDNHPTSDLAHLYLLTLDFLDGVPYVAVTTGRCATYNKWGRPNPPYVLFKYVGEWKRISLAEFSEKFTVNTGSDFNEQEKQQVIADIRQYGFVSSQTIAKINSEPGRSKHYYSILRTPIKNELTVCSKFE
jgi:hypothetical protein